MLVQQCVSSLLLCDQFSWTTKLVHLCSSGALSSLVRGGLGGRGNLSVRIHRRVQLLCIYREHRQIHLSPRALHEQMGNWLYPP